MLKKNLKNKWKNFKQRDSLGRFIKGYINPTKDETEKRCLTCNKKILIANWRIKIGKGKYCSKDCFEKSCRGKKHTEEHKNKIKESLTGEKNHQWKGGITKDNRKDRTSAMFELWRNSVFSRDNWTCQKCGVRGRILHAHHIQNFHSHPELRFAIDNGITLCKGHHTEFHKIYGRDNNTKKQLEVYLCSHHL